MRPGPRRAGRRSRGARGKGLRPHQHGVGGEEYGNQQDGDGADQHGVHLRQWAPEARARVVQGLKQQTMRHGIEERPGYQDSHAGKKEACHSGCDLHGGLTIDSRAILLR
jgi:hypothetical protein